MWLNYSVKFIIIDSELNLKDYLVILFINNKIYVKL